MLSFSLKLDPGVICGAAATRLLVLPIIYMDMYIEVFIYPSKLVDKKNGGNVRCSVAVNPTRKASFFAGPASSYLSGYDDL